MVYKIILASSSPRRQQLMQAAGIQFEVRSKEVEEIYPSGLEVKDIPLYLAKLKAEAFKKEQAEDELLITADTLVCIHHKKVGKPRDRADAIRILEELSGNKHTVITGLCLTTSSEQRCFSVSTDVCFRTLTREEIEFYIDVYKPYDKAGAYGIQEWIGYIGIERIEGSFYNVMGLPVQTLYTELKKLGITFLPKSSSVQKKETDGIEPFVDLCDKRGL